MKQGISWWIIVLIPFFSCVNKKKADEVTNLPSVHFTHGMNWTGEPAGAVYDDGTYHLFYQHNPDQPVFGNIHWGHAVSTDLVHWDILPAALSPDGDESLGSGSVIVDRQNTSGLGNGTTPPFITFYTSAKGGKHPNEIAIAYSSDKGRSWQKYARPVLTNEEQPVFRNPSVSWNEVLNSWLMTISTGSAVELYTSPDCLRWSYLSSFGEDIHTGGGWESSALFPLKGTNEGINKWVLAVTMNEGPAGGAPGIRYFIGDFDGKEFKRTQYKDIWMDYGKDNVGGILFNNAPDNRKIMIGWMNSWDYANITPANDWRGRMTLPRELSLTTEGQEYRLASAPVSVLADKLNVIESVQNIKLSDNQANYKYTSFPSHPFILKLSFDYSNRHAIWGARDYGIRFKTKSGKALTIGYKADMGYYYIDRSGLLKQPFSEEYEQLTGVVYTPKENVNEWFVVYDKGSVELFAGEGKAAISSLCYTDEEFISLEFFAASGNITLIEASISELIKKE